MLIYIRLRFRRGRCETVFVQTVKQQLNSLLFTGEPVSARHWNEAHELIYITERWRLPVRWMYARRAKSTMVEIEGGSHSIFTSRPEAVADMIIAASQGTRAIADK